MSVYVDDMAAPFGSMIMCHMLADTHEELVRMADQIGIQRKWIQKKGTAYEHFDICIAKKKKALQQGAIPIGSRELVALIKRKKAR